MYPCGKWVQARSTVKKKVTEFTWLKMLIARSVGNMVKKLKGPDEILRDDVETATRCSYVGDRLNTTGGCETAVTTRTRIGWMKFRKFSKILIRQKLFIEDEREGLQKLFKISYIVWK